MTPRIENALAQATETKLFWLGSGILGKTPEMFNTLFPGKKACVVADRNTLSAAGREVYAALGAAGIERAVPFIFEQSPHADLVAMTRVREYLAEHGAIAVAVGAGSINDICKRASFELGQCYISVATAASVDGYASAGAPVTIDGFKKTVPCPAPAGIVADIDVLSSAPYPMTASGYADLLAKVPAGADWIIADTATGTEPIHAVAWDMVQTHLRDWTLHPHELRSGDARALEDLFEGLTLSGLAMQAAQSSRPASGCEHMFSHVWEMAHVVGPDDAEPSHGFKVGIGSLAAITAMETVFAEDFTVADIDEAMANYPSWENRERMIRDLFVDGPMFEKIRDESRAKHLAPDALRARLERIAANWHDLRRRVGEQIMPYERFREMLRVAGCPVRPQDIGVSPARCAATAIAAQMIRSRYTVLDLAYETGRFADIVRAIAARMEAEQE